MEEIEILKREEEIHKKLVEWIAEHKYKQSGFLEPIPEVTVNTFALLDQLDIIFGLEEKSSGKLYNEILGEPNEEPELDY